MEYKFKAVKDLVPNARNSKTHTLEQIEKIAASIQEFGFINPIVINQENGVVSGHGRLKAAKKLKLKEVPVLEVDHLTEDQLRAFIIADNRLAEIGSGWNDEILRLELSELSARDFNIELTGFSAFDKDFSEAMSAADEFMDKEYKKKTAQGEEPEKCPYCGRPY